MADRAPDPAFVNRVEDIGEQLADATWPHSDYEYAVVELPATLAASRTAREWATAASVTRSLSEAERGDVMLVISELVTNAVRHVSHRAGERTVSLAVGVAPPRLRIEVCDPGTGFTSTGPGRRAADAPDGRGLLIVDAIAQRWGATRGDRHCVWTEIER